MVAREFTIGVLQGHLDKGRWGHESNLPAPENTVMSIHASRTVTIKKFQLDSPVAGIDSGPPVAPELPAPLGPSCSLCILLLAEADVEAPEVQSYRTSGAWTFPSCCVSKPAQVRGNIQFIKHCSCGAPRFGF